MLYALTPRVSTYTNTHDRLDILYVNETIRLTQYAVV